MNNLDDRQVAAILAGLRLLQSANVPSEIEDIASNGGELQALTIDEIDDLCEIINFGTAKPNEANA